jgi:AraC family transcriptional regulator of adaptative response/methylated-DNA-[protein]-cysteine methyltransferase
MIKVTKIETPLGEMIAGATKEGICLLEYLDRKDFHSGSENIAAMFEDTVKHGSSRQLRALKKQLKEYFKGKRKEFTLPLIIRGTDFQQDVWKELQKIPFGTTRSYLDQATSLNNPKLVRAVANANGSNRIAIIIPCHRVIGSDGSLVGYGGGLERKRWLIDHEKKYSGKPVDGMLFS